MPGRSLFLDRRCTIRVPYRITVQFTPDPARPLRQAQALTQDVSLRGLQILSSVIPSGIKEFDVWIPLEGDQVIAAKAKTAWTTVEDTFGDSSYWVRAGIELFIEDPVSRAQLVATLEKRGATERGRKESEISKVGFVF